jgi:peroxiredoxin
MKKTIFSLAIVLIIGVSFYTVNKYNKGNANKSAAPTITYSAKANNKTSDKNTAGSNVSKMPSDSKETNQNSVKNKAENFKLKDLNGKELSLSDLKGKDVFLNFWATWCPPCKGEMPEIEKLYQETKNSNLVIVAIEIGEPLNDVKAFIQQNNYNFKVLLDSDQKVSSQYGITGVPTSFFINKEGNIVAENIGAMNIDQMKKYIKTLDKSNNPS